MNKSIEDYFISGCGRCSLGGTPQCKVHRWAGELKAIRAIVSDCGLEEEVKWGVPVYTWKKKNLVMIYAFKDFAGISFVKGVLLKDTEKILQKPGENSQSARFLKFTSVKDVVKLEKVIRAYIHETIEVENAGLKVKFKKADEFEIPQELEKRFKKDPAYKKAFYALTPGRQRGYLLFFSSAKQSATREQRIEKSKANILKGKGMQDR